MSSPSAENDSASMQKPAGGRKPVLKRDQLDSDPRILRTSLAELGDLLKGCEPSLRRRVDLVFTELVARWQDDFAGEAISTTVELLRGEIRVSFSNPKRMLSPSDWKTLVSAPIVTLADAWGIDRRIEGGAWFVFRPEKDG